MSTAELHDLGLDSSHFEMFDWLGFDSYAGPDYLDPQEAWDSSGMPGHIEQLSAWLGPTQRMMAVPEAFWQGRNTTPFDQDALIGRINLWHQEILSDARYVAVVPFLWQDAALDPTNRPDGDTGTRSMPRVKERLRQLAAYFLNPNGPYNYPVNFSASSSYEDNTPFCAVNPAGDLWNSGDYPEQWIAFDLGGSTPVRRIDMVVAMTPNGFAVHEVRDAESGVLLASFSGNVVEGQTLSTSWAGPKTVGRAIRIVTRDSPSWVAWHYLRFLR